ncbi:MAG: 3-dehydroquinate synthase [Saprospiraceae bacterium]|nr:3-dehydroquinate synthase [Saprospiraceae bacterium]
MVIKQQFSINYRYDIIFTRDVFSLDNPCLLQQLTRQPASTQPTKVVVVIDSGLLQVHPALYEQVATYFDGQPGVDLLEAPLVVQGGEQTKNDTRELIRVLELVDRAKVDRHAYVIGIGGGSVLDMVGFAAAIAHRGIRHIRIPTTTLSQNDSGVGVKNGINYFGKKNFLGAFVPPYAVINDLLLLQTLDDRDWRSGAAEAVKVALIRDADFFDWIDKNANAIERRDLESMEKLVVRCAELHSEHIGGSDDPF